MLLNCNNVCNFMRNIEKSIERFTCCACVGWKAQRNTGNLQSKHALRDCTPKAVQTRDLISTLIFSSVAA